MAYPPYQKSRAFKNRSSATHGSDYSVSTTWAALDSTLLSTPVRARVGDRLEISTKATTAAGTNQEIFLDFSVGGTRIGGSTVGLYIGLVPVTRATHYFKHTYEVQFADIDTGGIVTVDLWAGASGAVTVLYNTPSVQFSVQNIGPADDDDE